MEERVVEGYDKYLETKRGVSYSIVIRNPYGFYYAKPDKGVTPTEISDPFTNLYDCVKAVNRYVESQKPLRVQENKEPPVLKTKPVRKRKQHGETASSKDV